MTVKALFDYQGVAKDTQDKFHGNQLVYVGWDKHLMFCAPHCLPLPPDMPFGALIEEVLPSVYSSHPDWEKIDWDSVKWIVDGNDFIPDPGKGLAEQGIGHKSVVRLRTPGLDGIAGVAS